MVYILEDTCLTGHKFNHLWVQHFLLSFVKTLSVVPAGVELATSRMAGSQPTEPPESSLTNSTFKMMYCNKKRSHIKQPAVDVVTWNLNKG